MTLPPQANLRKWVTSLAPSPLAQLHTHVPTPRRPPWTLYWKLHPMTGPGVECFLAMLGLHYGMQASLIPEWSSGFPYFLQFKSEFGNKKFTIWAIVSSYSCFCWLYRTSPSSAAKNITNLISVYVHVYSPLLCCWKRLFGKPQIRTKKKKSSS